MSVIILKLFENILNSELFLQNALLLKSKKFKAGSDRMTAEEAYSWIQINGPQLIRRLKREQYEPSVADINRLGSRLFFSIFAKKST